MNSHNLHGALDSENPEDPIPGPLRINKSPGTSPSPAQSASMASHPAARPPYPTGASYTQPTSPPPTRPLPYPEGRARPAADNEERRPSGAAGGGSSSFLNGDAPSTSQYYYPPPGSISNSESLRIPNPSGVNRLASTSSVSTTKAARGSPPPPETPASDLPIEGGIEARYAAAGISGPATLSQLQAQSLAAQQRQQQYQGLTPARVGASPPAQQGADLKGPPNQSISNGTAPQQNLSSGSRPVQPHEHALEQDMERLNVNEEPPPAYSSVTAGAQQYPSDKRPPPGHPRANLSISTAQLDTRPQTHPAFAHEAAQPQPQVNSQAQPQEQQFQQQQQQQQQQQLQQLQQPQAQTAPASDVQSLAGSTQQGSHSTPSPTPTRTSPPPLPEGWIAHMDPSSGQYYYIHLPTQSTQWEFPKGPTPLNLNDQPPLSPTGTMVNNPFSSPTASTFGGKPLASPGLVSLASRPDSVMTGMSGLSTPTAAGFHVPPPSSGVDAYRVTPTNGVYFGPYLRYTNMDVENGYWYGSILLVTDSPHPPTIHIHQSQDLSPNPRQLKANHIYNHQRWSFHRYDIDLKMEDDHEAKWTYAITSHLGCTRYEFLVAARYETSWRFIAHSGNDFGMNVSANERQKIGGIGYMWKDIMQKHAEVGGFHVQLGMGNQIYADRLWKEVGILRQWTAMSGKDNRKQAAWSGQHEEEVTHAYFHYYTSHFDQPFLREAFAQIPHVLTLDDHEIFDGFGSYPEHMQFSNMFKNIGRIGIEMYLLFQHHTTLEILRHVSNDLDLFTITGTGWHFIKYLGPAIVVVGPDCRSERNPYQVMAGPTYQGLFPKIAILPPHVQHCIWMIPVPLVYPRLDTAEHFAQTVATGKKAVTGLFNATGKVTAGLAGIVGAKAAVGEGFNSVKKAIGKSGLMSNVLSPFGELDILDELRDQWTHESKDLERTYLIRTLQGIAHSKSLRMSFFSGAVNACGAGMLFDPGVVPPSNSHKAMWQIISSSVVNAPPSPYVLRLLHPSGTSGGYGSGSGRPLYVPPNGHKSRTDGQATDTKEDMLDIFTQDPTGQQRELKRLMNRRNYVAVVSFDPEAVNEAFGHASTVGKDGLHGSSVSLAVDFFVQSDATYGAPATATVKYGPLTIPAVPPGH